MPGPVPGYGASFGSGSAKTLKIRQHALLSRKAMSRAKAIQQSDYPYHITGRCINKEWFNLPMDTVWRIFCEELNRTHQDHELNIHSFVLMSNHFHLIASTPQANISRCMHQFMTRSSRLLTSAGNRINETYAGRHYKCILNSHNYYLNAYKYNYRNPIMAGICSRVEDYAYSSLQLILNNDSKTLKLAEDSILTQSPASTLQWLNTEPDALKLEGVSFALRRSYFRSKRCKNTKKALIDINDVM